MLYAGGVALFFVQPGRGLNYAAPRTSCVYVWFAWLGGRYVNYARTSTRSYRTRRCFIRTMNSPSWESSVESSYLLLSSHRFNFSTWFLFSWLESFWNIFGILHVYVSHTYMYLGSSWWHVCFNKFDDRFARTLQNTVRGRGREEKISMEENHVDLKAR